MTDKERKGRMKAKQCLSHSESFLGRLKISYETTLKGPSSYLILNVLPGDTLAKLLLRS